MFSKLRRMYYDHIDRKEYKKYATPEEKAQPNDKQQELRKALLMLGGGIAILVIIIIVIIVMKKAPHKARALKRLQRHPLFGDVSRTDQLARECEASADCPRNNVRQ